MKKLVKNSMLALLIPLVYFICATGFNEFKETGKFISTTPTPVYTFTNAIFNTGYNIMLNKQWLNILTNLGNYKDLNFNSVQWYDWAGSDEYGKITDPLSGTQISNFNRDINRVNDSVLLGFYERSYISSYCYGQRLIYEVKAMNDNSEINNGFVYEQCMPETYSLDGNRTVLHANPSVNTEGYLCKNIYENLQHSDLFGFRSDDKGLWHIKPVMKIPTTVDDTTRVVRIEIMAFDNPDNNQVQIPVRTITITAGNFNNKGIYNDVYNLLNPKLEVYGDYNNDNPSEPYLGLGMSGVDWWNWDDKCNIDFRVYWYGECDVWFDQMIVDDHKADELFNTTNQITYINDRIKKEIGSFANTPGNYSFFVDEVTISNIPCMKYVYQKMRDTVPNVKISFALTDFLHILSLKNDNLPFTVFFDSLQPSFVQHDSHKFQIWDNDLIGPHAVKLPNTINDYDEKLNPLFFTDVNDYNNRLQNRAFGYKDEVVGSNDDMGSLLYEIYKVYKSKPEGMADFKFIMQPQIHGYLSQYVNQSYYAGGLREPTNEEIQAQATISIAHGVNGLCWYIYGSEVENLNSNNRTIKGFDGLLRYSYNLDTILYIYALLDKNYTHRHKNCSDWTNGLTFPI